MILQALYEYYQRKAADPGSTIAPHGLEWKEIPYPHAYDHNKSDISSSYLPLTGGTLAGDLQFASYENYRIPPKG